MPPPRRASAIDTCRRRSAGIADPRRTLRRRSPAGRAASPAPDPVASVECGAASAPCATPVRRRGRPGDERSAHHAAAVTASSAPTTRSCGSRAAGLLERLRRSCIARRHARPSSTRSRGCCHPRPRHSSVSSSCCPSRCSSPTDRCTANPSCAAGCWSAAPRCSSCRCGRRLRPCSRSGNDRVDRDLERGAAVLAQELARAVDDAVRDVQRRGRVDLRELVLAVDAA